MHAIVWKRILDQNIPPTKRHHKSKTECLPSRAKVEHFHSPGAISRRQSKSSTFVLHLRRMHRGKNNSNNNSPYPYSWPSRIGARCRVADNRPSIKAFGARTAHRSAAPNAESPIGSQPLASERTGPETEGGIDLERFAMPLRRSALVWRAFLPALVAWKQRAIDARHR
jgi:hypothetical protein